MMNKPVCKITTIQLAKICNVSQGTVDRALNNREGINIKTKEKILKVAKEYGYIPNIHARSLSCGKSFLIGIVVFDLYNAYFSRLVMGIEQACKEAGYSAVVLFSHKDKQCEAECLNQLCYIGVDGIVLCPISEGIEYERFLNSLHIPLVTVGNTVSGVPFAGINDYAAMKEVTEHVIRKGYSELVYFSPPLAGNGIENISAQLDRCHGFLHAAEAHSIRHIIITDEEKLKSSALISEKTAVICSTDYHALKVYVTIRQKGAGIIGFDDIDETGLEGITLDTVGYSCQDIAQRAVKIILTGRDNSSHYLNYHIISRGSLKAGT